MDVRGGAKADRRPTRKSLIAGFEWPANTCGCSKPSRVGGMSIFDPHAPSPSGPELAPHSFPDKFELSTRKDPFVNGEHNSGIFPGNFLSMRHSNLDLLHCDLLRSLSKQINTNCKNTIRCGRPIIANGSQERKRACSPRLRQ